MRRLKQTLPDITRDKGNPTGFPFPFLTQALSHDPLRHRLLPDDSVILDPRAGPFHPALGAGLWQLFAEVVSLQPYLRQEVHITDPVEDQL